MSGMRERRKMSQALAPHNQDYRAMHAILRALLLFLRSIP